ncbi:MAG: hypothetical protein MI922_03550 [Bacteroidales bacterium]|nr:hypothetical protein [Bacteroidales bacterium]
MTTTQNNQGTEGAQPRITMGETHGRHKVPVGETHGECIALKGETHGRHEVPTKRNNRSSGLK